MDLYFINETRITMQKKIACAQNFIKFDHEQIKIDSIRLLRLSVAYS